MPGKKDSGSFRGAWLGSGVGSEGHPFPRAPGQEVMRPVVGSRRSSTLPVRVTTGRKGMRARRGATGDDYKPDSRIIKSKYVEIYLSNLSLWVEWWKVIWFCPQMKTHPHFFTAFSNQIPPFCFLRFSKSIYLVSDIRTHSFGVYVHRVM